MAVSRQFAACILLLTVNLFPFSFATYGATLQRSADAVSGLPSSIPTDDLAPAATYTDSPNAAIPDDGYTGAFGSGMACSTIDTATSVPAGAIVAGVSVSVTAQHTWVGDLTIKLRGPNNAILTILNRPGSNAPDNGVDSPTGDNSNWSSSLIDFGRGLGPEAETMGASLSDAQSICASDGICAHDPTADTAATLGTFEDLNDQNAAGLWTLCMGDSAPLDVGTFVSWNLNLSYAAVFSASPNASIPDDAYAGGFGGAGQSCSTVTVPALSGGPTVLRAPYIDVDISHTWVGDMTLKLRGPDGTIFTVLNRPGSNAPDDGSGAVGEDSNWNGFLQFRDGIGPEAETMGTGLTTNQTSCVTNGICRFDPSPDTAVSPASFAAAFVGRPVSGSWTLCAGDSALGDLGTLRSWMIKFPESLAPTAAGVTVAGTVRTPLGSTISKARVTLVSAAGERRVAMTNGFGQYRFEDVPAGQTYVIAVEAKGYVFESRAISLVDEMVNLDFVGQRALIFKQPQ